MRGLAFGVAACLLAGAAPAQAPQSLPELQAAARAGNVDAQFRLGEAYRTGTGVATDRDQAITWFKRAADHGSQPARDALGMLLFTRGNRQEAMPLIEAAAARGDARALYILATARFNGDYVARDWARSYAEMSRAAELGLPQAKASLTQMEPYLLPADRVKAEQIRATMAAAAPAPTSPPTLPTTPLPRAAAPVPPRIAAAPAPVPGPRDEATLGLPSVPAATAQGRAFDLAAAEGSRTRPAPSAPAPVPPAAVLAPPVASRPAAPRPVLRQVTAPTPSPARGDWRVQLGAYSSKDRAEAQWRTLAARHASLAGHGHAVTAAGAVFRLQAEGVAGREAAAALCREVAAGGAGCFAVAP